MSQGYKHTLPGGATVTVRELRVGQYLKLCADAARLAGNDPQAAVVKQAELLREFCLVSVNGMQAAGATMASDLIDRLSTKQTLLLDKLITRIHEPTAEEQQDFFGTCELVELASPGAQAPPTGPHHP